ncbi:glycoside hydrolase family 5 protein [Haloplasma contractile]|uniref:Glucan 13-beta-glucosidase protein n=1 Tax=Haloplasma contractile SSD-17B TaxID=1033810 RepID=F7Q0Y2_9MOLU|nr:cellulase family glycosylhydrolase [Haloplasma contractile]ERJ11361.1 glucan 13-beta-glucosidase protein [Haloplasma contractile SSD-17B]
MNEKINRNRVKGFLKAKGRTIVNGDGEEIILTGWGLGNWLLPEGYMWMSHTGAFDRPRRIEAVIRELTGSEYSKQFWKRFRDNYITKEDIQAMADQGYNSVRIPFNWRNLMENEPGLIWKEEGFKLLDQCIDWCEQFGIYAFLDMHGAPGGQTGANIDDSIDDRPRLFLDEDSWSKGLAIWRKLAERYKDRWIVGGYDLLNEPIRPKNEVGDYDYLVPKLSQFYEEAIATIREVDPKHLFSIEGHHWSTRTDVFHKKYDDNMVIHFHRYACLPDKSAFTEWLELSQKLDAPLWLGETGENLVEWYTAIYPLSVSLGIGYNLWPWKKMNCTNSPYSIKTPEGWSKLLAYTKGGPRPSYDEATKILDEYLENMKVKNCNYNKEVTNSVFRIPGCSVRATDFDELPGKSNSFSGIRLGNNDTKYRSGTGMCIKEDDTYKKEQRFYFDCMWDRFLLNLEAGEFATYSINHVTYENSVVFEYTCDKHASISIYQDDCELGTVTLGKTTTKTTTKQVSLLSANEATIKVSVNEGGVDLARIYFK